MPDWKMTDQTAGLENGSGERPSEHEGLSPDPFSIPAVWSAISSPAFIPFYRPSPLCSRQLNAGGHVNTRIINF